MVVIKVVVIVSHEVYMSPSEIISCTVAVVSLIFSTISLVSTYREKHIKTKIRLQWISSIGNQINANFLISNMSSRPTTITNISFRNPISGCDFSASPYPVILQGDERDPIVSDATPINVAPRSSISVVMAFQYLGQHQTFAADKTMFTFIINEKKRLIKLTNPPVIGNDQMYWALRYLHRASQL